MSEFVIIGSGAAGIAAAESIRRADSRSAIRVFTNDSYLYYSRPGLAYLLAGEVPQKQLFPFGKDFFRRLNLDIQHQPVEEIDCAAHRLRLANGALVRYDRLLLATGAAAAMPKIPGADLEGVVKLDSLEDAERILKLARKTRTAVVVGGGITALELAEGLVANGVQVHYFLRGERYWSNVLDEVESRIVENRLTQDGIQIHYFTDLTEIFGRGGRVCGIAAVEQGKKMELPCQMVAIAIGIAPRIDLAVRAGLNTQRGVIVEDGLSTSHADVFAAGDIAQVYDPYTGEYLLDSLWRPAIEQGWVAGLNMAGGRYTYEKKYPFNVTRLGGLVTTIIGRVGKEAQAKNAPAGDADLTGIMRGDSETWRRQPDGIVAQTYQQHNRLRLYVGAQHLTGAVVMGDQSLSRPIQVLIRDKVDITPIREKLLSPYLSMAVTLTEFWQNYPNGHAHPIA